MIPTVSHREPSLPKGWPRRVGSAVVHAVSNGERRVHRRSSQSGEPRQSANPIPGHQRQPAARNLAAPRGDPNQGRKDGTRPGAASPALPTDRTLAILELRAARGWSLAQTARRLLVTPHTIASWTQRLDDDGPDALVQTREPVNRFPEFVGYLVQRLKVLCPRIGTRRIARVLARAGLHLGATTVRRMLEPKPKPPSKPAKRSIHRAVTAKGPNHLWHLDLTTVPTIGGFWISWLPFALPQRWPFCSTTHNDFYFGNIKLTKL